MTIRFNLPGPQHPERDSSASNSIVGTIDLVVVDCFAYRASLPVSTRLRGQLVVLQVERCCKDEGEKEYCFYISANSPSQRIDAEAGNWKSIELML